MISSVQVPEYATFFLVSSREGQTNRRMMIKIEGAAMEVALESPTHQPETTRIS